MIARKWYQMKATLFIQRPQPKAILKWLSKNNIIVSIRALSPVNSACDLPFDTAYSLYNRTLSPSCHFGRIRTTKFNQALATDKKDMRRCKQAAYFRYIGDHCFVTHEANEH